MADRRGTGGRGSLSTLGEGSWGAVPEQSVITRLRTERSPLFEAVRSLLATMGQQVERMNGVPEGSPEGTQPQPHTYSKTEAVELIKELRRAAGQLKLPQRRLSLKITTDPSPLSEASDEARVRVQMKVEKRRAPEVAAEEAAS